LIVRHYQQHIEFFIFNIHGSCPKKISSLTLQM
jgi:hypothetical protein